MILSHSKKFIFFKTLKTSSTSLEIILSKYLNELDVITPIDQPDEHIRISKGFKTKQNYKYSSLELIKKFKLKSLYVLYYKLLSSYFSSKFYDNYLPPKFLKFSQHQTAESIKANVSREIWNNYYKFTILRNPIDQIVSNFFYVKNNSKQFKIFIGLSFEDYLSRYAKNFFQRNVNIFSINGKIIVDFIIKYEDLERGLDHLINKLNLDKNIYDDYKSTKTKSNNYNESQKKKILTDENLELIKMNIPEIYKKIYKYD